MKIHHKYWSRELWLLIFIGLISIYFLTISKMPNNITGAQFIDVTQDCGWCYLTDEFQVENGVLNLNIADLFYSKKPLEFFAFSNNGKVFLENDFLVFFPEQEVSILTILAKNKEVSCSKTLKIMYV